MLVPIREKIRELRDEFLSSAMTTAPEADLATQMKSEGAAIQVLNGTWTPGLASGTADYLAMLGFTIAGVGDAENKNQAVTQIIDYGGKTATVNYLADLLDVPAGNIYGGPNSGGEYDIHVILGADWQLPGE